MCRLRGQALLARFVERGRPEIDPAKELCVEGDDAVETLINTAASAGGISIPARAVRRPRWIARTLQPADHHSFWRL